MNTNTNTAAETQPLSALDIPLDVTLFTDLNGRGQRNTKHTLREIAEMVRTYAAPTREQQPLLKLGTFVGGMKGHHITEFSALMGDHDKGTMQPEKAADCLRKAGIAGLIYTTGRHTPEAPRFRALIPLADVTSAGEMQRLTDKLNTVLDGALASESWNVAQRFYYGHVEGQTPTVIEVEGAPIDTLPHLPAKHPRPKEAKDRAARGRDADDDLMNEIGRDWTVEEVQDLLDRYPNNDLDWSLYRDVGMMLKYQYRDDSTGKAMFHAWASRSSKYDQRTTERDWKGYGIPSDKEAMKIATLAYRVKEREELDLIENDPEAWLEMFLDGPAPANDADAPTPPLFASAADWLQTPPTPREWLVRDMVPMGTVTLLTGHGGTGKSLLALQLAVAAATGDDWIGKRIEQPGAVVFFSAEDSVNDLKLRLTDICNGTMTDMSELKSLYIQSFVEEDPVLANFSKEGKIQKTKLFRQVSQFIEAINPKLLVLDTLSNIHTGNEVDKQVAVQFINLLKPIAAKHNCSVLLLAHPSMSGMESGEFGSRGWHNTVRSRLFLKKDKDSDLRVLTVEKQNYGATGGEMFLRWVRGAFDHGDDLIDTTEAETEFLRMLNKLTKQGRNVSATYSSTYAPAAFSRDPECAIKNKRRLADAMNNLLTAGKITVEEFGSESRRRTRLVIVSEEA